MGLGTGLAGNGTSGGGPPADASITTAKLADNSVTSAKIVDGAIVNDDINASAAIALTKLASVPLVAASNLSDIGTAATARTNLGLGTAAVISATAGGDLTGTLPSPTVAKINGVVVTGTPSVGYVPTATSSSAATWQAAAGGGGDADWVAVSGGVGFQNSWTDKSGSAATGFRKDGGGRVDVRVAIVGGTNDATAFTLPAGYRPAAAMNFTGSTITAASGYTGTLVNVASTGVVGIYYTGTPDGNGTFASFSFWNGA